MALCGELWVNFMLMGEYHNNLDPKGRIVIPSKFREILGDSVVLTRGLDGCLFIYSVSEFQRLTNELSNLSFTDKDSRNFVRFLLSVANTLEFDKQGRIVIPNYLKMYANLEKEVILVGVLNRIEVWSSCDWNNFMDSNFYELSQISADLFNSN